MKLARKRAKASLDRTSRKYIVKNIKTCTDFAKTYRDRVSKSVLRRQSGGASMSLIDNDDPQ
jgi:hypothetical protein